MPDDVNPTNSTQEPNATNEGANGGASGGAGGADESGQGSRFASLDDATRYIEALEKRVTEWQDKAKTREARAQELEAYRQKTLEEQGNYKSLLDDARAKLAELQPQAERYAEVLKDIEADNKRRIEALPEDVRDIVPTLAPVDLRKWLDTATPKLTRPTPPSTDAGRGTGSGSNVEVTEADVRAANLARAQGLNITAEQVAKRRTGQA